MQESATVTPSKPLRRGLRLAALVVLAAAAGFWAAKGGHRGWSMDQVPVKQTDEVTGLEYVTYEDRYVPGVDFLGLAGGLAAGLFAVSFFVQRKSSNPTT
jgi:hypothetical protein